MFKARRALCAERAKALTEGSCSRSEPEIKIVNVVHLGTPRNKSIWGCWKEKERENKHLFASLLVQVVVYKFIAFLVMTTTTII